MHSRLPRGLAVVVLAMMMVGCGKTTLDTSSLEQSLRQQLEAKLGQRLTVTCPSGPEVKAGATFQCVVAGPGYGTLTVEVTEKDDEGSVTWEILGASISGSASPLTPTPSPTV